MPIIKYNDKASIINYCASLAGLNKLVEERRNNKEECELEGFIINGSWVLDSAGQCIKITKYESEDWKDLNHSELIKYLPLVIKQSEMFDFLPRGVRYTTTFQHSLPKAEVVCSCCNKPWTVSTAHNSKVVTSTEVLDLEDYVGQPMSLVRACLKTISAADKRIRQDASIQNDKWIDKEFDPLDGVVKNPGGWAYLPRGTDGDSYIIQEGDKAEVGVQKYYHPDCHQRMIDIQNRDELLLAVAKSGITIISATKMPNSYGSKEYNGDWQSIITPVGKLIIGWRKRVIHLDYSNCSDKDLFPLETNTKYAGLIHADNLSHLTKLIKVIFDSGTVRGS